LAAAAAASVFWGILLFHLYIPRIHFVGLTAASEVCLMDMYSLIAALRATFSFVNASLQYNSSHKFPSKGPT
jgi:hypothetical protein